MTIISLFDGSGGFPRAAKNGELQKRPPKMTKREKERIRYSEIEAKMCEYFLKRLTGGERWCRIRVDSKTKIIEGVEEALKNLLIEKADAEISRLTAEFERSLHRKNGGVE